MKKSISILLSLLLVFGVFTPVLKAPASADPAPSAAQPEIVDSGCCGGEGDGTNLTWTLLSDGTLTISGTGAMADYGQYYELTSAHEYAWDGENHLISVVHPEAPWMPYRDEEVAIRALREYCESLGLDFDDDAALETAILDGTVTFDAYAAAISGAYEIPDVSVVVEEGVTYIGANAFPDMDVHAVSLPSTLEGIGYRAFVSLDCGTLTLPEGLRFIDPEAFSASTVETLVLPSTLEYIGEHAFFTYDNKGVCLHDITVLNPAATVDAYRGLCVSAVLAAAFPFAARESYYANMELASLLPDYYWLRSEIPGLWARINASAELNGWTAEQARNRCAFDEAAILFGFRTEYGVDLETADEMAAYLCARINELLGTGFSEASLLEIHEKDTDDPCYGTSVYSRGEVLLTAAADAAFAQRYGASFNDSTGLIYSPEPFGCFSESGQYVPAPWITLRVPCGSGLLSAPALSLFDLRVIEHDPARGEITAEPTCVTPGWGCVVCPVCHETFSGEIPVNENHTPGGPVRENASAPSCTEDGAYDEVVYCTACGAELGRERRISRDAPGHIWGDWEIVAPPTATEEGEMRRVCRREPAHTETAAIPAGELGEHELLRGYCGGEGDGKNLIWSLSDDHVITVSGTGRMADYGSYLELNGAHDIDWDRYSAYERVCGAEPPWPWVNNVEEAVFAELGLSDEGDELMLATLNGELLVEDIYAAYRAYLDHPYTVVIEEGVTYVGANAFTGTRVTALSLPSSLEEIGWEAFGGLACEKLVVPEGVRWLDPYAFYGGEYERVSLPSTLESVGTTAICVFPDADHVLHDITVLSADENLSAVVRGIYVAAAPASQPQLTAPEDYKTLCRLGDLLAAYYFLYYAEESVSETLAACALELGITPTAEQRANLMRYLLNSTLYDMSISFEFAAQTAEEGMAFLCGRINELLGTSLSETELILMDSDGDHTSVVQGEVTLALAADAAFAARFGIAFSALDKSCSWYTLRDLKSGIGDWAPAAWVTLHGPCGGAFQGEFGSLASFVPAEHALADVPPAVYPTCTEPGEKSVVCPGCGETFTETLPALGHSPVALAETPATATEHGHTDGIWCTACEMWLSGGEVIHNKLGESTVLKEATETEEGEVVIVCTVCGESGLYAIEKLPEGENGKTFFERIKAFAKGIIDVLLRLIRWLGGNKT